MVISIQGVERSSDNDEGRLDGKLQMRQRPWSWHASIGAFQEMSALTCSSGILFYHSALATLPCIESLPSSRVMSVGIGGADRGGAKEF